MKKNAEYRERIRAARRRYRESHKEELRARHQRRWKSDPAYRESIRAARRRYRESHKEELRERHRRRWEVDPVYRENVRAARRRYRASHKEELRERRRLKRLTDHAYRERQLTRERQWQRKKRFKVVYGISLEDYDVMLERQNGACAICGRKPDERLAVDHCTRPARYAVSCAPSATADLRSTRTTRSACWRRSRIWRHPPAMTRRNSLELIRRLMPRRPQAAWRTSRRRSDRRTRDRRLRGR